VLRPPLQILCQEFVGLLRLTLKRGQLLSDLSADFLSCIPRTIYSGEQPADSDATKRRCLHVQIFEEAHHGKRGERCAAERSEDQE
jgi:hypothetical protein